jgi:hypothetical protein
MRRWKGSHAVNGNRLDPITLKAPNSNMGLVPYGVNADRHRPAMEISDGVASPGSARYFLAQLEAKLGGRSALHGHYARLTMESYRRSRAL